MNRILILFYSTILFSVLVTSHSVVAQVKTKVGIKIGAGISSLHGNAYGSNKFHRHIGLPLNFEINKHLEIEGTFLLSNKGYSSSLIHPKEKLNLYYLDYITTLKFTPYKIFFIGGGFYTGGLLYSHYEYLAYSRDYYGEPDLSDILHKLDYGLNGSIGCQFKSGIGFEFSVSYGLQDVFNSNRSDTLVGYSGLPYVVPAESNGKNMVIATSFYYLFGKNNSNVR